MKQVEDMKMRNFGAVLVRTIPSTTIGIDFNTNPCALKL